MSKSRDLADLVSAGNIFADGNIDVSELTGVLTVPGGGTGLATLTANNVMLGNGESTVQFVAPGDNGNILTSNGTTWASAAPAPSFTTGKAIAMAIVFG